VQVTTAFKPEDRTAWSVWLEHYPATADEVRLLLDDRPEELSVSYLDAVEEAICFGRIDSGQNSYSAYERAQPVYRPQATE
jgi:hypothetical protein